MDQKNVSNLDPKLREAYDRVMGFSSPHSKPTQPKPEQKPRATTPTQQQAPQPTAPLANYQVAEVSSPQEAAPQEEEKEKKKAKIGPVIFLSGGLVMLVLYAIFWIRFLGIQLF